MGCNLEFDDSDGSEGWSEMETESDETFHCLFCSHILRNISDILSHCKNAHQFDLVKLKAKFNMDCYSYIKLINFLRTKPVEPSTLINLTTPSWNDEIYMKPIMENDPWLMLGIPLI